MTGMEIVEVMDFMVSTATFILFASLLVLRG